MKFVIERSTWRCGINSLREDRKHGLGGTALLNREGFRCCLGSVCSQLGVPDDKLLNVEFPRDNRLKEFNSLISILIMQNPGYADNTELTNDAININDNPGTSLTNKELELTELFKTHGHELEFIGIYNHDKPDLETENESSCANQSTTN